MATKGYFQNRLDHKLAPNERTPNPSQIKRIPAKFDYIYRYNIEAAYKPILKTTNPIRKNCTQPF